MLHLSDTKLAFLRLVSAERKLLQGIEYVLERLNKMPYFKFCKCCDLSVAIQQQKSTTVTGLLIPFIVWNSYLLWLVHLLLCDQAHLLYAEPLLNNMYNIYLTTVQKYFK